MCCWNKHWCLILLDVIGLSIGLVGLGFNIATICTNCIHNQHSVQETLQALDTSQEIYCLHWIDIVGLVMNAVGLALAVISGSGI